MKSLNTVAQAKFYDGGFHTWYNYEKKEWSQHRSPVARAGHAEHGQRDSCRATAKG